MMAREFIKDCGQDYMLPDRAIIAKFSRRECTQLAKEMVNKNLVGPKFTNFGHLSLSWRRKLLIKAIEQLCKESDKITAADVVIEGYWYGG